MVNQRPCFTALLQVWGRVIENHFADFSKMVSLGSDAKREIEDWRDNALLPATRPMSGLAEALLSDLIAGRVGGWKNVLLTG